MAEHKGGSLNPPPRLLVEDNGASHPLRESGGGLGMVLPPAEHVPGGDLSWLVPPAPTRLRQIFLAFRNTKRIYSQ